ncbi:MAG: PaaI family thioesterase [Maricaulaceae bacterium]|nr:PaaI family thioesterase [Maricaulaceae bacterium]
MRAFLMSAKGYPKASVTLGFRLIDFSVDQMWLEAEFDGKAEFTNPAGNVQGGFVTAMLDEVMSLSAVIMTGFASMVPTLEMKTSFLRPLPQGLCRARGQVLRMGNTTVFMEGRLWRGDGELAAVSTATAALKKFPARAKAAQAN